MFFGEVCLQVERAKRSLSTTTTQRIEIEAFFDGTDFSETLTRAKFEELDIDLFKRTMVPVQKVRSATPRLFPTWQIVSKSLPNRFTTRSDETTSGY